MRIDFVSDVVCPWCIVGYRQLQHANDNTGMACECQNTWLQKGVQSVPVVIIESKYMVSGAQGVQLFEQCLQEVVAAEKIATHTA